MAYSSLVALHSSYKPTVMLIGLVARELENSLSNGVYFLVMLLSLGNARSMIVSPSPPLR